MFSAAFAIVVETVVSDREITQANWVSADSPEDDDSNGITLIPNGRVFAEISSSVRNEAEWYQRRSGAARQGWHSEAKQQHRVGQQWHSVGQQRHSAGQQWHREGTAEYKDPEGECPCQVCLS